MGTGCDEFILTVTVLSFCKSTVDLGELWLGSLSTKVGVPTGTGSIIPSATSQLRSSFTFFFQWWEMGIGVYVWITECYIRANIISNYFPIIICKSRCGLELNALDLKWLCIHCSSRCLLVFIGRNGMILGIGRIGSLHGSCALGYFLRDLHRVEMPGLGNQVATDVRICQKDLQVKTSQVVWLVNHLPHLSQTNSYMHEQHSLYIKLVVNNGMYLKTSLHKVSFQAPKLF